VTRFRRSGHYRTSPNGTLHWVNEHTVDRDDWSYSGGYYGWDARSTWGGGAGLDSPNAICPECKAAVYFIRPANGGAVWFDDLGPPWPKHACMDSGPQRARFPAPIDVPDTRVPGPVAAGWDARHNAPITAVPSSGGYWLFYLGGTRLISAAMPPSAQSPVHLRWSADERGIGEVQYLSLDDGVVTPIVRRVYSLERVERGWPPRRRREMDWRTLECWIQDVSGAASLEVETLVADLKEKVDWLLDDDWATTITGPRLVRNRVEQIFAGIEGVEASQVFAWIKYLLR
jgi:hypothetical protein